MIPMDGCSAERISHPPAVVVRSYQLYDLNGSFVSYSTTKTGSFYDQPVRRSKRSAKAGSPAIRANLHRFNSEGLYGVKMIGNTSHSHITS